MFKKAREKAWGKKEETHFSDIRWLSRLENMWNGEMDIHLRQEVLHGGKRRNSKGIRKTFL